LGLREIEWGDVDWMQLAQDRNQWRAVVNTVNEPLGSVKGEEFFD
jgi:hypothetical protein